MAAKITTPHTETFDAPREHRSFRLDARTIAIIEDIAMGVEAGESGLKSCALAAVAAGNAGADAKETSRIHHRQVEIIEDEDECFDAIGNLLAAGFSHAEVADQVALGGGATHLLALERWCDKVRLSCDADATSETPHAALPWRGSALHERRRRGHRAMAALRANAAGTAHAAVLHIVYGWADPFVNTLPPDVRVALGREFAPLARYTDTVEAKRQELAQREAVRSASDPHGAVHLAGYRERLAREERILSSGDAIRAAIAAPRARHDNETKEEHRECVVLPARNARDAFLTAVKIDANRMLTEASLAFRDAWAAS